MKKNGTILVGEGAYLHIVRVYEYGLFCYPRDILTGLLVGALSIFLSFHGINIQLGRYYE